MHLTKADSYYLGRYLAGAPSIDMEALSGPDAKAAAQALLAANGGDRPSPSATTWKIAMAGW